MRIVLHRFMFCFVLLTVSAAHTCAQGPPFQTDDPVPVDQHRYELYAFGSVDGTPAEVDSVGPAVEFNWGAFPRAHLHAILPWGAAAPLKASAGSSIGAGPVDFGLTDTELGAAIAYVKEGKHVPQISTYTMMEIPSGSYANGLGVGRVWYKLPLWLQKNFGPWLVDGGGGETLVQRSGFQNFPYGGFLVKYSFGERLQLGSEIFAHGKEGPATPHAQSSTMVDMGGYYHFKHKPNEQFLFCYGHSIAGQTENYAYAGLYWEWGKGEK